MSELFGPGWGNYAIRGIVEVSEPDPISLLPVTAGWWILLGAALFSTAHWGWRWLQRWRRNRYRREALAELRALRSRIEDGDHAALRELAPLLRATALHVLPRAEAASCSGTHWRDLLAALAPQLPPPPVDRLHHLAYAPAGHGTGDASALLDQLEQWIATHRGPDD